MQQAQTQVDKTRSKATIPANNRPRARCSLCLLLGQKDLWDLARIFARSPSIQNGSHKHRHPKALCQGAPSSMTETKTVLIWEPFAEQVELYFSRPGFSCTLTFTMLDGV